MPTGKNKVPMAPLRAALEAAGLREVRTYIQSGNVIVTTGLKPAVVERLAHDVIREKFGGDITVISRLPDYLKNVLAGCPFKKALAGTGADTARLYFTFLATMPDSALLRAFLASGCAPDRIKIVGDMAYILCATKYSDAKINNSIIERKLKLRATMRNYNTVTSLIALTGRKTSRLG